MNLATSTASARGQLSNLRIDDDESDGGAFVGFRCNPFCGSGSAPSDVFVGTETAPSAQLFRRDFRRGGTSGGTSGGGGGGRGRRRRGSGSSGYSRVVSSAAATPPPASATPPPVRDPMAASELAKLSADDRNRLYEEIHGCFQVPDEDPTTISKLLQEMSEEIRKVKDRSEYNKAHFLAPSKVTNPAFRLMFLRAATYNPRLAARRLVLHFQYKAMLFGRDKVAEPITLDDLDEDDKRCLNTGCIQFLPGTDMSGRRILFYHAKSIQAKSWKSWFRVFWYITMTVAEDEMVQTTGAVAIGYNVDAASAFQTEVVKGTIVNNHVIRDGIPLRWAVYHFLYDSPPVKVAMTLLQSLLGREMRLRFRDHFGSHQECLYQLLSYGISTKVLPFDSDGNLKNDTHLEQVAAREAILQQKMQAQRFEEKLTIARANDVILGRGKSFQIHPGNQRLAELVEARLAEYQQADKNTKTNISMEIVDYVKNVMGGRFLQKDEQNPEYWEVATDKEGRLKIAHAFRACKAFNAKDASGDTDVSSATSGDAIGNSVQFEEYPFVTSNLGSEEDGGRLERITKYKTRKTV